MPHPSLIGLVPRKELWDVICEKRWYHAPVKSFPKNSLMTEYVAFYFPKCFDKKERYKVCYYSKVQKIDIVKRVELFPDEPKHERAREDYYQFHLGEIRKLPRPIPSKRWRRVVFIPTSREKLFKAKEINDLYDTSPLEDKMYREMKKRKIDAERQVFVKIDDQTIYCLDFGVFCRKGDINVECDGEKYHLSPEMLVSDRKRNNQLTSFGWYVLRFSGKDIDRSLSDCFKVIEKTISNLGGLSKKMKRFLR